MAEHTKKDEKPTPGVSSNDAEREGHTGGQHSRDKAHQHRSEAGRSNRPDSGHHARQHDTQDREPHG